MAKKLRKPAIGSNEAEEEFNLWCDTLLRYTKAVCEYPNSAANWWIFRQLSHDAWRLAKFPKHLASENAFNGFINMTGKDIRDCDWLSTAKDVKTGETFQVHSKFKDEHLTTANDFREKLLDLYGKGKLTIDETKKLLLAQRVCWITEKENKSLDENKYKSKRDNPLEAYKECGIEIHDLAHIDASEIMKRT